MTKKCGLLSIYLLVKTETSLPCHFEALNFEKNSINNSNYSQIYRVIVWVPTNAIKKAYPTASEAGREVANLT